MRFTIERLRTIVLAAGVLLIVALAVFLGLAKWKNKFIRRDLPGRLGINIQEEANGWTSSHEVRGHTVYKIHASKQIQLKKNGKILLELHDVYIEFYGEDGKSADRIEGAEFDYDPQTQIARAAGEVAITLMRPGVAPAIAPKASTQQALHEDPKNATLAAAASTASRGEVHVKTSGLSFNRNSGEATTSEKVEFELAQGSGSAVGAMYQSQEGRLILDNSVQLVTTKGEETVHLQAAHAEFERGDQICHLIAATIGYREGNARAEVADIQFRDDGTAERMDADQGFLLTTRTGGKLTAPTGILLFDERNQPRHGHLQGGVVLDSDRNGRKVHGTSPTMDVEFAQKGVLRAAHLERGVQLTSDEQARGTLQHRTWISPEMDVAFRDIGHGKVEPASIHGMDGVIVTGLSQRGSGPAAPSRFAADDVMGQFGSDSALTMMTGKGHASIAETTAAGTRQTTSGDTIVAHFSSSSSKDKNAESSQAQIESATVDGNVVMLQEPATRAGQPTQPSLRATAGRAVYESAGEWLHLTAHPRVVDGGLDLGADKIDVSQDSGDAFAHGNVKATWIDDKPGNSGKGQAGPANGMLGGQGPAHAVAAEARLHQATGEATFRGKARLWQQSNSIDGPMIALDRNRQTLTAHSSDPAEPVQVVLVSAVSAIPGKRPASRQTSPSVVRVSGGDLKYSAAERKAIMHGGSSGNVTASTGDATTFSSEVELILLPPGNHAGKDGTPAQVDRMTARGHVAVNSGGRRGTGEKLVYTTESANYVLTGTAAAPPQMSDPSRGTVTGEALIFNSRDDSVSIEGGGRKTTTVTTAPK